MSSTMLCDRPRAGVEDSNGGTEPAADDTLETELVDEVRRCSRLFLTTTNKSSRNFLLEASSNAFPSWRSSYVPIHDNIVTVFKLFVASESTRWIQIQISVKIYTQTNKYIHLPWQTCCAKPNPELYFS